MPGISEIWARYFGKGGITSFAHEGDRPASNAQATVVEEMFWSNEGPVVHKWHHYLPISSIRTGRPRQGVRYLS